MSGAYDAAERKREDDSFRAFLIDLVENGDLEEKVRGITRLVIDKGTSSLSEKQSYVFTKEVIDVYGTQVCQSCGAQISWDDAFEFYHSGSGLCSGCEHSKEKFFRE